MGLAPGRTIHCLFLSCQQSIVFVAAQRSIVLRLSSCCIMVFSFKSAFCTKMKYVDDIQPSLALESWGEKVLYTLLTAKFLPVFWNDEAQQKCIWSSIVRHSTPLTSEKALIHIQRWLCMGTFRERTCSECVYAQSHAISASIRQDHCTSNRHPTYPSPMFSAQFGCTFARPVSFVQEWYLGNWNVACMCRVCRQESWKLKCELLADRSVRFRWTACQSKIKSRENKLDRTDSKSHKSVNRKWHHLKV